MHDLVLVAAGFFGGMAFTVLVGAVIIWEVDMKDALKERSEL